MRPVRMCPGCGLVLAHSSPPPAPPAPRPTWPNPHDLAIVVKKLSTSLDALEASLKAKRWGR